MVCWQTRDFAFSKQSVSPTNPSQPPSPARDDLAHYGHLVGDYTPARHHQEWINRLRALVTGQSERRKILFIAPPGAAKSTWISLLFPPWYLGQHPDQSLLFFTSSDTMARQFGTTVKTMLELNEAHATVFPETAGRPDPDRGWSTDALYLKGTPKESKDAAYRALGYGASVVGARAHGLILDDPLTQQQSQSALEVEKAIRYHDMTVDTRLHPSGWEVAIMTRWAMDDFASRLMARDEWDVLAMPSIGYWADGEALWPERFSLEWLEAKRREIGVAAFQAVFLGDPTALGGQVFRAAAWFRPLPADFDRTKLRVVQFFDLAFSRLDTADYTASLTIGVDAAQNLYLLDGWRARIEEAQLDQAIADQIALSRPHLVGIEAGLFKKAAAVQDLVNRLMRQQRVAVPIRTVPAEADKVLRAQLPAGRAQAGMVFADQGAPWWPDFLRECLSFPLGANDDWVDAFSGATRLAIEASAPQVARKMRMGG